MRGKATKYKTQYLSDHDEKVRILTFLLRRKSLRLVSVSYQSRIVPVSSFVLPSFLLLSLFYHSRFQKRKQYGNNTETIRKPCGIDTETIGGTKKEQGRRKEERRVRRRRRDSPCIGIPPLGSPSCCAESPSPKWQKQNRTSYSDWFHSPVFRWRRSPLCSTLLPPHRAYLHGIYLFAQKSL